MTKTLAAIALVILSTMLLSCLTSEQEAASSFAARVSTERGGAIRSLAASPFRPGPPGPPSPRESSQELPDITESPFHRFQPNLIRHDDGTFTKFFYFRSGQGENYHQLLLKALPGYDKVQAEIKPNFIRDPRVPNTGAFRLGQGIPSGVGNVADLMVVRAEMAMIGEIDRFLGKLFRMPQIEVEARVVEITLNDRLEWGITTNVTRANPEEPVRTLFSEGTLNLPTDNAEDLRLSFSGIHDETTATFILDFITANTDSDILSMPKMVVLNGHRGVIDTGQETPVLSPKIGSTGDITGGAISFKPTGIKLIVTPFLVLDNVIELNIAMEVSTVTGLLTVGSVGGVPIENPEISKRAAATLVRVRDGETIAVGGLLTRSDIDDVVKVPILGDIPILGYLFKKRIRRKGRSEVIFFITPRILESTEALLDPMRARG